MAPSCLGALALAGSALCCSAQPQWTLNLVDDPTGMARCLDGSSPGYYVRPGHGSGSSKWVIHLQGGGWCATPEDCLQRANGYNPWGEPSIGGSGTWPRSGVCPDPSLPACIADGGDHGMLSPNATINPDWYNANAVWIGYCDGSSFAGHVEAPQRVGNATIYLRGRFVLDAIFASLVPRTAGAADVVLKGCSAGGQAAFIHANRLVALFAGVPRVSVMPGAGFFMDVVSYPGPNTARPFQQAWFTLHNISGSLPAACLAAPPEPGLPYLCAFPQYILPHLGPPVSLFVSQSLADAAQQGWVMELGCNPAAGPAGPGACNASQVAYLDFFRGQMVSALAPVVANPRFGLFALECSIHVIEDNDGSWAAVTVEGQTQRETFAAWYSQPGGSPPSSKVVDGAWGSNPTCAAYSPGLATGVHEAHA